MPCLFPCRRTAKLERLPCALDAELHYWMRWSSDRGSREGISLAAGIFMGWSGISRMEDEPERELARLMNRMKPGLQALLVVVLAGTMAFGAVACPLWMASRSQTDMPCSNPNGEHEKCPLVICLASSS